MTKIKNEKTLKLTYLQAKGGLANLKNFRTFILLSKDQRNGIREIINTLEDLVRPADTEISTINAEYSELKSHKKFTEDVEAFKKFLAEQNLTIDASVKKNFPEKEVTITPVEVSPLFKRNDMDDFDTKEDKARYYPLFLELEDKFLI